LARLPLLPCPQFLRYYRSTLLQIIAPFFFMLLLFIIQQAAKIRDIIPEPHPAPYPLPGIAPCKVRAAALVLTRGELPGLTAAA